MTKKNIFADCISKLCSPGRFYFKPFDHWIIWAFVFSVAAFVFTTIVTIGLLPSIMHSAMPGPIKYAALFFIQLPLAVLLVISAMKIMYPRVDLFRHKLMFRRWRLRFVPDVLLFMVWLEPLVLIVAIATSIVFKALNIEVKTPSIELLLKNCSWSEFAVIGFFAAVVAPIVEEIIFRRIIFGFLVPWSGKVPALILTSIIFAFAHDAKVQFPALFLLGAGMQMMYIRSRSIYPSMLLHAFNNSIALGFVIFLRLHPMPEVEKMLGIIGIW